MKEEEEKTKGDKNTERAFLYHLMPAPLTFKKNVPILKEESGWLSRYTTGLGTRRVRNRS
jgi:hypothetical protein